MKIRHSLLVFCAALAVVVAGVWGSPAKSGTFDVGPIRIDDAWVRESPIGAESGGGYMRIVNVGKDADRLLGAESAVSRSVVLKEMSYVGDKLQTRALPDGIEIPPGANIRFRWEAYHLLFVDLKEPFDRDKEYEASLKFEKAGDVTVKFRVKPRVHW